MGIDPKRTLQFKFPEISKEWHPTLNGDLTPNDVYGKSSKKFWWQCLKDNSHIFEARIADRTRTDGKEIKCTFCSAKEVSPEKSLAILFPDVAKEWHPNLNEPLTSKDVSYGSNKKVWWQCRNNKTHIWEMRVCQRTSKSGKGGKCKMCIDPEKSLATLFPDLAKEWHYEKNFPLTPKDITYSSKQKVWWQCPEFENHVYDASISSRTHKQSGCSYCGGVKVSPEKSLANLSPELAKEWHPTLNGDLTPKDVFSSSNKKVWWQCKKFKNHIWQATIDGRYLKGYGCRFCAAYSQSSKVEMRILSELRYIFKNVIHRKKFKNIGTEQLEVDIYLPDLKLGIEYDGFFYHKNKKENDSRKNNLLEKKGYKLIRLREEGLEKISENDLFVSKDGLFKEDLNNLLKLINQEAEIKSDSISTEVDKYIKEVDFLNQSLYQVFIKNFPSPLPEDSLNNLFPKIAKEWHYEKNFPLTPLDISFGSKQKVWWQCPKFESHVYQAVICERTRAKGKGTGCSYCAGKKVSSEKSLATLFPDLAKEWHPTLNGDLTPNDVLSKSSKKVWWQSMKDNQKVFLAKISDRTKYK